MPPKLTGKALLERWKASSDEHKSAPTETGGAGHALPRCTRDKLAAGHLSRSEIAELNRLEGEVTRGSSTNSGDSHPAVASGVGAKPGAASRCDSGAEQPAAAEHVVAESAKAPPSNSDSSGVKQLAAHSKNKNDVQPRKRLCLGAQAPRSPSIAADPPSGSSIAQPAPSHRGAGGGFKKPAAMESSSSGVAQSATAKQLPSHAGRVLHTGSSDVAQLAATCQEPRTTVLFMKVLEPI